MNTIPAPVLLRALASLQAALRYLNDKSSKDPYVQILTAHSELDFYVNDVLKNVKMEVEA